jgi:hypothetical protein
MTRAPGAALRGLVLFALTGCSTGAAPRDSTLAALKQDLDQRRRDALRAIFDAAVYRTGDERAQYEVDRAVARVRELWLSTPGLRDVATSSAETALIDWNRRAERYNSSHTSPDVDGNARAHARIINDYREMMGRRRLFLDPRLCRAAIKHARACDRAGRVWHAGDDGDPVARARAEQFDSEIAELVCIGYGNPGDVWWDAWYRSSDDHRTALGDGWNCLGYGYAGRVGALLLGRASPPGELRD